MSNFVKKLKIIGNKNKMLSALILITLIALTAFAATASLGKAQAQTTTSSPTYPFIAVEPNPAGVNQTVEVTFWLSDPTPNTAGGLGGDLFSGLTVTITDPNGTPTTMGPYIATDEASAYFAYTPAQIGNYTFQFNYPGQTFSNIGITYAASNATAVLTIQQQPVQSGIPTSLPTSFWTTPVNGANYPWSSITSNWLQTSWNGTTSDSGNPSTYDPEGIAPTSSHVLWTNPLTFGGIVGGQMGTAQYYDGQSYEEFFKPPVIIDGRLYYDSIGANEADYQNTNISSIICLDLATGQTLFTIPNAQLSFGQIYNYVSPNQAGAFAYLWSTPGQPGRSGISGGTWKMYDANTGQYILTISGVPSGDVVTASDGSILIYSLAYNKTVGTYQLSMWNSTIAIQPTINTSWTWRPYTYSGQTINASQGIQWTVNEPNATGQALSNFQQAGLFDGNILLTEISAAGSTAYTNTTSNNPLKFMAYDMTTGANLWNSTILPPANLPNDLNGLDSFELQFEYSGILFQYVKQTLQWTAYNVQTGTLLWTSQPYTSPWDSYNQGGGELDVNGIFYAANYNGNVVAYNDTTGQQLWTFNIPNAGSMTPYGTWVLYNGIIINNNELFLTTGDHGNGVEPLYQGEAIYALNLTTGTIVWSSQGWYQTPAIANGILVSDNAYDNQIYAFGQGPSATSVSAPDVGVTTATPVTITGSVMDISAGTQQSTVKADFPNGVPCVSDSSMSQWMSYVYSQQIKPTNVNGVQVTLSVIDSNNNQRPIGTTTTDSSGTYAFTWTPDIQGNYTVIATFAGTQSYYGSSAETHFYASSPPATPTPTAVSTSNLATMSDLTITIAAAAIAIIIAIAIVGLIILRKRP